MRFSAVTLLLLAGAAAASAQEFKAPKTWTKPFPPFRMIGNVYWVGSYDLSSYLITTPAGHILINTGVDGSVPQIQSGVEKLGFKFSDIKIITATHAHWDHVAGLAEIKKITGARLMMSERDVDVLESGGKSDFRWGDDPNSRFAAVQVDRKLKSGDKIELGGVVLTARLHAGHTKGATSFTFDIRENGKLYRVGIVNMASINPGVRVSGMPKFPEIEQAYAQTFHDQKELKIDVWLASHASQFDMHKKHQPNDAYNPDRFVDPEGYRAAVNLLEKIYQDQLAKERNK